MCARLVPFEGSRVFLVENGSHDDSLSTALSLQNSRVRVFSESKAGVGYAYVRGIVETVKGKMTDWIVLTASDLPFGFSDLEAFQNRLTEDPSLCLAVGSKYYQAKQNLRGPLLRRTMSSGYWLLRRCLLGMRTRDCQGSIFIRTDIARRLVPNIKARNYFFSTELIYSAEKAGIPVIELSVETASPIRPSTVRPFRDSACMLFQLMRLAQRSF